MSSYFKTLLNENTLDIDASNLVLAGLTPNSILYVDTDGIISDSTLGVNFSFTAPTLSLANLTGFTTDSLSEGKTNLYYTDSRSRLALSAGSGISYNNSTGVISATAAVASIIGTADQVLANGTSGSAQTGTITLTLPQSIATTSSVEFAQIAIGTNTPNALLHIQSTNYGSPASANNFRMILAGSLTAGYQPGLGVDGTDDLWINSKTTQRFYISASEKMRLNTTGLGINTSNPDTYLHVKGNSTGAYGATPALVLQGDNAANPIDLVFARNTSALTGQAAAISVRASNNDLTFYRFNSNWYETMRILNASGNVGIANDNPLYLLTVGSSIYNANPQISVIAQTTAEIWQTVGSTLMSTWFSNSAGSTLRTVANVPLYLGTNNTNKITITGAGLVGIGCTPGNLLSLANNSYMAWRNAANSSETVGIISTSSDDLRFYVNGTRMYILPSGYVGIGVSPSYPLHVSASVDDPLYITTSYTNAFTRTITGFAPSIGNGQTTLIETGTAASAYNTSYFGHYKASAGSSSNLITFGMYGIDHILTMSGAGNVAIGYSTTPATVRLSIKDSSNSYANPQVKIQSANSVVSGGLGFDGLYNTDALYFYTGGSASHKMIVTYYGDVGIGYVAPNAKLHVKAKGTGWYDGILIEDNNDGKCIVMTCEADYLWIGGSQTVGGAVTQLIKTGLTGGVEITGDTKTSGRYLVGIKYFSDALYASMYLTAASFSLSTTYATVPFDSNGDYVGITPDGTTNYRFNNGANEYNAVYRLSFFCWANAGGTYDVYFKVNTGQYTTINERIISMTTTKQAIRYTAYIPSFIKNDYIRIQAKVGSGTGSILITNAECTLEKIGM